MKSYQRTASRVDRGVDAGSVGAGRSGQFEIGLAAVVDMNRCITRADGEFTFAPTGNDRHISARDFVARPPSTKQMCFRNPLTGVLRPLILFDLQATARGGFRNPLAYCSDTEGGTPFDRLFVSQGDHRDAQFSVHCCHHQE